MTFGLTSYLARCFGQSEFTIRGAQYQNNSPFQVSTSVPWSIVLVSVNVIFLSNACTKARLIEKSLDHQHQINHLQLGALLLSHMTQTTNLPLQHVIPNSLPRLRRTRQWYSCSAIHDHEAHRRNYLVRGLLFVKVSFYFYTFTFMLFIFVSNRLMTFYREL